MNRTEILYPLFALAALTFVVLTIIPIVRIGAARTGKARPKDFALGESDTLPDFVRLPSRNYMTLLELPQLFYVVCILFYLAPMNEPVSVPLAWAFVALRAAHSLVHITINHILSRLGLFALGNFVLIALWVIAARAYGLWS